MRPYLPILTIFVCLVLMVVLKPKPRAPRESLDPIVAVPKAVVAYGLKEAAKANPRISNAMFKLASRTEPQVRRYERRRPAPDRQISSTR